MVSNHTLNKIDKFYSIFVIFLLILKKLEGRMATDEDLKLGDLLRYHTRDAEAAKGLLYRRMRCLANLETSNKNLDKARAKNKDVATVRQI